MRKLGFVLGTASAALMLISCSGGGGGSPAPLPVTVTIASGVSGPMTVQLTRTFTATVANSSNTAVNWSVLEPGGGSITSGGVYTASATPGTFTVKATAAADASASATAAVQVVAAPSISSFNASSTVVYPALTATTLTAVFSSGTATINQGVGTVTSGTPVTVNPSATTTYTLTVTNAAGAATTSDRQILYETQAPTIASFTANPLVAPFGQPFTLSWTLGGGIPNQLLLNGSTPVLGQTSYAIIPSSARRWSYYLTASNPNGSTGNIFTTIAAQGMDSFAGSVIGGWGAENGTGTAARAYYPDGMACDAQGNVYLTDESMNTVRKITPAGVVTALAGSPGMAGLTDGAGAAARFNDPNGIVPDASGNLFVCDTNNHTIRKIAPDGTVSTFAGLAGTSGNTDGTGPAARFYRPFGITRDSAGNFFVGDSANQTIRKITPLGVVTTFAGLAGSAAFTDGVGSAARFHNLLHLGIDGADNLYVADNGNNAIRKVTPFGQVTTLAGNGTSGNADGTGASARFWGPIAVVADPAGNVYVGDTSNSTVRKITPGGVVTTFAGTAGQNGTANGVGTAARFNYIWSLALDPSGNLYVGDDSNHAVRKIAPDATVTTFIGKMLEFGSADGPVDTARFLWPDGVCVDAQFNTYIADSNNHTIRRITPVGQVTTLAGSPGQSGNADGIGNAARFSFPRGITLDGAGNLYVCDSSNYRIRKITPSGTVSTYAGSTGGFLDGTGAAAKFNSPQGITIDAGGNLYVADSNNHSIRKVAPGGVVTTLAGNGTSGGADGTGATARFQYPRGIGSDSSGNLYVADTYNQAIRKITPGGTVTTLAGTLGTSGFADGAGAAALFNYPYAVVADPTGNLWVNDYYNRSVRKVTPAGVVSTLFGSATSKKSSTPGAFADAGLGFPYGLAWWPAGDLLVTAEHGVMIVTAPNGN